MSPMAISELKNKEKKRRSGLMNRRMEEGQERIREKKNRTRGFPSQTKEEKILLRKENRERKKSRESWGPLGLLKKKEVIFVSSKSLEK